MQPSDPLFREKEDPSEMLIERRRKKSLSLSLSLSLFLSLCRMHFLSLPPPPTALRCNLLHPITHPPPSFVAHLSEGGSERGPPGGHVLC